jgi:hypothetical protein
VEQPLIEVSRENRFQSTSNNKSVFGESLDPGRVGAGIIYRDGQFLVIPSISQLQKHGPEFVDSFWLLPLISKQN